ncbi:MAG: nitrilase-related carbon-nitrogen hydrolase [Sulfurimonas sp.]
MTSKKHYKLASLLFETGSDYEQNLQTLLTLVKQTASNTLIVAPEVCLTSYDYDNFESVIAFASKAIEEIKKVSYEKIIVLTLIEKHDGKVFNFAKVFHNGEVVYERAKARLFRFGDEHKYLDEGSDEDFEIVSVDGIKLAVFICFELRFKELWHKSEGADVICVSAWWGVSRTEHFRALTQSLAIINQCYVVASDAQNKECTAMSGVISPMGEEHRNGNKPCLEQEYIRKDIDLMRRYMDVGIQ